VRIQFPTRISPTKTLIFAVPLFGIQQIEHTSLAFSLLFFAFVVLGNFAFNAAGGFSRASGAYVFLYAMLLGIVGVVWKAVLGEPADSNLKVPILLMAVYAASMAMLLVVMLVNHRLTDHLRSFASRMGMGELNYTLAALGCLAAAFTLQLLDASLGSAPGSLLSILNQLNLLMPLALILGTIGAMRDSGGYRSINFINGVAMLATFLQGVVIFSKQAMLTPLACWVVAALYARFNLRRVHMLVLIAFAIFTFTLVPLISSGRNEVPPQGANYAQRAQIVINILSDVKRARERQQVSEAFAVENSTLSNYFDSPQGFLQRLTIIPQDDAFLNYTALGNNIGYLPIMLYFENFIPHFILPDKPPVIGGNYYAHLIGGFLSPDDFSTGISFSPASEAYQIDGWRGVCLLLPAVWLLLFFITDYLCGDLRKSPWGLLMVVVFAHAAAESMVGGLIYLIGYGSLSLMVAIIFSTRVAPIIGALFYGRQEMVPRARPRAATALL
jgi:hypothetical protein